MQYINEICIDECESVFLTILKISKIDNKNNIHRKKIQKISCLVSSVDEGFLRRFYI